MTGTCIWCGLEMIDDTTQNTVYACGSMQHSSSDVWSQSTGCEEIMRLCERVQRAVEAMEGSYRIIIKLNGDNEDVVFATDVDRAVGILEGEEDGKAE